MSTNEPEGGWPPPPPPPSQYAPGGQPPYGQPPYGQPYGQPYGGYGYEGYGPPQTEGMAVGALVCAIAAWVTCIPIAAIVALVLASSAQKKIAVSGGRLTGEGMVTATKWIAWVNLVLWALMVGLFVVLGVIGALAGDSNEFSLVSAG